MSELSYNIIYGICYPALWVSSSPVVLHADRVPAAGAFILAPNHLSPFDVPCLLAVSPRRLDFLSIVEMGRKPFVGWVFRGMNAFFHDRGRVDPATVRTALDRLNRGRVVAMFPEAAIRPFDRSVVRGGPFKPGVARLAHLSGAPVVPCVVLGTGAYARVASWLPLRRTRYGVIFGHPITPPPGADPAAAEAAVLDGLKRAYLDLYDELRRAMPAGRGPEFAAAGPL